MMVQVIGVSSLVALMRLGERGEAPCAAASELAAGRMDDPGAALPEGATMNAASRAVEPHGHERH